MLRNLRIPVYFRLFKHKVESLKGLQFSTKRTTAQTPDGASDQSTGSKRILLSHTVYDPSGEVQGPPLFIAHGLLGSKQNWNSIAKAIAKAVKRKVICFDARNHGDSPHTEDFNFEEMSEDILYLATHLRAQESLALMGHSMGGRTVMTFALKYPEIVEKLVVVDVSPYQLNADFHAMKAYVSVLKEIKDKTESMDKPLSEIRKVSDIMLKSVVMDHSVRAFLLTNLGTKDGKAFWKPNIALLLEKFEEVGNFSKPLLERQYDKPTLFIRGQKSLYIPISDFPELLKTFPNAKLSTVENAGHWPHAENTVRFMEFLLPFLAEKNDLNTGGA